MSNLQRRQMLHAGIALTVPFGGMLLHSENHRSRDRSNDDNSPTKGETVATAANGNQDSEEMGMQIQYLEIVTPEVDALCEQYSAIHGVTFSDPIASFGNARTANLKGGGKIGIRGPMRESETPVIRPYVLVENIKEAVAAAEDAGAEIAIRQMEIPGGHGTIAIVIQGGIECGLWQL